MKLIVVACFLLFIIITSSIAENCDKLGILLYEDLGCTPHYADPKGCPTKYTCTGLESDQCYFRGKLHEERERVNDSLLVPPCDKGCFCGSSGRFVCAILDCPEWLGSPLQPNCYRKYTVGGCCSTGQICPPFDNVAKCVVDGKEYREGERFSPANSCLYCVCQKGFEGKFVEPFCKRRTCNVQLRDATELRQKCAPLFEKEDVLCCPYNGWICPDGSEEIKGEGKSEETCQYGEKTLKVGQKFERTKFQNSYGRTFDKVECECVIPPLLTCTAA